MNASSSPVDVRPDHLEVVRSILSKHLPVSVKVWVFGSRANWTTKDFSDLDLAVQGTTKVDHEAMISLENAFEESNLPYTVDVVDLNAVDHTFRQIVESQKVLLLFGGDGTRQRGRLAASPMAGTTSDWRVRSLYDVADYINGRATKPSEVEADGVPVIKIAELHGGITERTNRVSAARVQDKHWVRDGDLVFAWSGSVGIHVYRGPDAALNQHIFRVVASDAVDQRFLQYLLTAQMETFQAFVDDKKTTMGHVTVRDLKATSVSVPPLPEQRAIAHVLGTLDDKIELNRRMNETLEEIARALFKSWFVDFDPVRAKAALKQHSRQANEPDTATESDTQGSQWTVERARAYLDAMDPQIVDLFPDRLVDSELGEIPEGWKVGVLDDTIELLSGGTPRTSVASYWGGDVPWYTATDAPSLSDVFVLETERTITEAGLENSAAKLLLAETTIITARGTVGRLACLGVPMAMNQTCYGIRGANGYPNLFTYWHVRTAVDELQQRTHGTIFDTITRQTFTFVETVLPPAEHAMAFESTVNPLMRRILGSLHDSRDLAAQRDALLPMLMSGRIQREAVV